MGDGNRRLTPLITALPPWFLPHPPLRRSGATKQLCDSLRGIRALRACRVGAGAGQGGPEKEGLGVTYVCACVSAHMYVCGRVWTRVDVCVHVHVWACLQVCTRHVCALVCGDTYMWGVCRHVQCGCVCVYSCVHVCACTHLCLPVCMYLCVVCTCVHGCVHVHVWGAWVQHVTCVHAHTCGVRVCRRVCVHACVCMYTWVGVPCAGIYVCVLPFSLEEQV